MSKGTPRMAELLRLCTLGEPVTAGFVVARTGWIGKVVSKTLSNAKALGYVAYDRTAPKHCGQMIHALTDAGRIVLDGSPATRVLDLADRAIALIVASEAGLDSEQLAEVLVASNEQVMAALAQAVQAQRLVACRLVRGGVEMRSYRKSAGSPLLTPWTKPLAFNALSRRVER